MINENSFKNIIEQNEIVKSGLFTDDKSEVKSELDIRNEENKANTLKSIFFINNSVDTKKHISIFLMLGTFILLSIISCIINKTLIPILSMILPIYITFLVISKIRPIKNTYYGDVAIWNITESLNILIKSEKDVFILSYNTTLINIFSYIYIFANILSCINCFSFLTILSFISLMMPYILCLANKEVDLINSSLELIVKVVPVILIISNIVLLAISKNFYTGITNYIIFIFIYALFKTIEEYEFKTIR